MIIQGHVFRFTQLVLAQLLVDSKRDRRRATNECQRLHFLPRNSSLWSCILVLQEKESFEYSKSTKIEKVGKKELPPSQGGSSDWEWKEFCPGIRSKDSDLFPASFLELGCLWDKSSCVSQIVDKSKFMMVPLKARKKVSKPRSKDTTSKIELVMRVMWVPRPRRIWQLFSTKFSLKLTNDSFCRRNGSPGLLGQRSLHNSVSPGLYNRPWFWFSSESVMMDHYPGHDWPTKSEVGRRFSVFGLLVCSTHHTAVAHTPQSRIVFRRALSCIFD